MKKIDKNKKNIFVISISIIIILILLLIMFFQNKGLQEKPVKVNLTEYQNDNVKFEYSDIWKIKISTENDNGSGDIRLRLKKDEAETGDVFIQYDKDFSVYYENNSEFYKSQKATYSEKTLDNGEIIHTWELVDNDMIFRYDYKSTEKGDIVISSQFKKEDKGHVAQIIETISINKEIIEIVEDDVLIEDESLENLELKEKQED